MGYSRNFGFRSFENIVRDARFRVPRDLSTGGFASAPVVIGTAVTVDPDVPGTFKRPAASSAPTPLCGIVLYEHIQNHVGVDTSLVSTYDAPFNLVPPGQYAQMIHGVGTKVWFKNTTDKPTYDGRTQEGGTLVDMATNDATPINLDVNDYLTPAADGTWQRGTDANGWLIVEQLNPNTGLVEARFTF